MLDPVVRLKARHASVSLRLWEIVPPKHASARHYRQHIPKHRALRVRPWSHRTRTFGNDLVLQRSTYTVVMPAEEPASDSLYELSVMLTKDCRSAHFGASIRQWP